MKDPLSSGERSERMSRVRATGNKSTELRVAAALRARGISGWRRHLRSIPGRPDFYFPKARLAVFVDGCFWHACPKCARRVPRTRAGFWEAKIESNRRRDARVRRQLRALGIRALRVWEHELKNEAWSRRLLRQLARINRQRR